MLTKIIGAHGSAKKDPMPVGAKRKVVGMEEPKMGRKGIRIKTERRKEMREKERAVKSAEPRCKERSEES
jgi:hypothetical protein